MSVTAPRDDPWLQPSAPRSPAVPQALWWVLGGCGLLLLSVVGAFVAFTVSVGLADVPGPAAVPGQELAAKWRTWLVAEGLLAEGEEVLYFYSSGLYHIREECAFFTAQRLVYLNEDGGAGESQRVDVRLEEIMELEFEDRDELGEDSVIHVYLEDEERDFSFPLDTTQRRDEAFEALLRTCWEAAHDAAEQAEPIEPALPR